MKIIRRAQRGISQLGLLLTVLLFGVCAYLGLQLVPMWMNYYEILGHMEAMAKKTDVKSEKQIREFLEDQIRKMRLPIEEGHGLKLEKRGRNIVMELEWDDVLAIDLGEDYYYELWVFHFNPRVEEQMKKKRR